MMRTTTSLSTLFVLSLGLTACGDDKGTTTDSTTNTTPMTTSDSETGGSSMGTGTGTGTTETTAATVEPTTTEPGTTTTEPGTTTDPSTTGTTTEPGTTGTTTEPGTTTGGGADLYGPCDAMGMCPEGQDCLSAMGIEGNFCSPKCDGMMCPDANTAAMPQCALSTEMAPQPTNCALICPAGKDEACPMGMTCKDVPMQMGIGLCTAP